MSAPKLAPPRGAHNARTVSGERKSRYVLIRETMAAYISPILVDAVLGKAIKSRKLATRVFTREEAEAVVEESMLGLRLFVDPKRLPALMLALAEILSVEDDG